MLLSNHLGRYALTCTVCVMHTVIHNAIHTRVQVNPHGYPQLGVDSVWERSLRLIHLKVPLTCNDALACGMWMGLSST